MCKFFLSVGLIVAYYVLVNSLGYSIGNMGVGVWASVFLFIPLIGIPLAVFGVTAVMQHSRSIKQLHKSLAETGFITFCSVQLPNNILLIDSVQKQLCVAVDETATNGRYSYFIYPAHNVLSCSIVSDDEEVTRASTSSVVGRALVGGLLFAGVGAIVGGATASTMGESKIRSLELRILADDPERPGFRVPFFSSAKPVSASSIEVKPHIQRIQLWQTMIELLIADVSIPQSASLEVLQDISEVARLKLTRQQVD